MEVSVGVFVQALEVSFSTFTPSSALAVLERLRSKRDELPQVLSTVDLDKVKQALELAVHGKLELPKEGEPALSPTSLLV